MSPNKASLAVLLIMASATAWAVNARGRVDFVSVNGKVPMNQAFVELCLAPPSTCLNYRTGYDGMYYFNASPGAYFVRINGTIRHQLVIPNVQTFDLPPLQGN